MSMHEELHRKRQEQAPAQGGMGGGPPPPSDNAGNIDLAHESFTGKASLSEKERQDIQREIAQAKEPAQHEAKSLTPTLDRIRDADLKQQERQQELSQEQEQKQRQDQKRTM